MIYHITSKSEWEQAQKTGAYTAPSLDTEGFIHCSTREQILRVANAFYRGNDDLVLLCINEDALSSEVKWEDPVHPNPDDAPDTHDAELFPHVYGTIGVDKVATVVDFPERAEGFNLPENLP